MRCSTKKHHKQSFNPSRFIFSKIGTHSRPVWSWFQPYRIPDSFWNVYNSTKGSARGTKIQLYTISCSVFSLYLNRKCVFESAAFKSWFRIITIDIFHFGPQPRPVGSWLQPSLIPDSLRPHSGPIPENRQKSRNPFWDMTHKRPKPNPVRAGAGSG